ncbi:MAG: DEAD/DEAH box helicase [Oligoflexia bacterium]|nr:DEAD/DEAH box helicase [Oligoflexia bacterium]
MTKTLTHPSTFDDLKLISPILHAVRKEGYETPTPIQRQAIPVVLAQRDLLGCAQTGTGKTAAFALPILQLLNEPPHQTHRQIRALILTPTRELASQIGESFTAYGHGLSLRTTVIFGGVGQRPQEAALRKGVDIVVATPGRLLDLMEQRLIQFRSLEIFVLDEADRMLDMGFIHDVRRVIAALPRKRQTLFFSATMPPEIAKLADQILTEPVRVEVAPAATTAEKIAQAVFHVQMNLKTPLLIHLLGDPTARRVLVFTRTKRDANRVAESLNEAGIGAAAIHGNKSQGARERALDDIKSGKARVLVATDIAARGIDIDDITHVYNYDVPNIPESYVHRIGRTARAGKGGIAVSLCAPQERSFLRDIERLIRKIPTVIATPEGLVPLPRSGSRPGRSSHSSRRRPARR